MSVAFNKYQDFVENLCKGTHQLHAAGHALNVALSNTAPNAATHTVLADASELSTGNGYTAGGQDTQNDMTESGGVATVTGVDVVWTASGGMLGPFQYVILFNDTAASDNLVGWWDYGAPVTLQNGDTFTVDFGASMFTVT